MIKFKYAKVLTRLNQIRSCFYLHDIFFIIICKLVDYNFCTCYIYVLIQIIQEYDSLKVMNKRLFQMSVYLGEIPRSYLRIKNQTNKSISKNLLQV